MNLNRLQVKHRADPSRTLSIGVRTGAVVLALLISSLLMTIGGRPPTTLYTSMFKGTLTTTFGLSETMLRMVPLLLCGLGIAMAARMKLWNIGAEGQFHMGAIGAGGVAFAWPGAPAWFLLPAMAVGAMVLGGCWAFFPAFARAKWETNEIITTLLLNYVAINVLLYLVYGPWKDPESMGFPQSPAFSGSAQIPMLWGRLHWGFVVAILVAAAMYVILWFTRWGYELRVIGESSKAARYAGISISRNTIMVLCVSGALAGLAGMMEVSGVIGRLQRDISPGYGYTAIIVAFLAQLNPVALVVVSFLFGALQVGGFSAQISGIPIDIVDMITGLILFCAIAGEFFIRYRLVFRSPSRSEPAPAPETPGKEGAS